MKYRIYGQYVQFNQRNIDWCYIAKKIKEMGYNAISIHFLSPWGNTELYPWKKVGTKYNLNTFDEVYFDNLSRFVEEMFRNRIAIFGCFFDRYFESKWRGTSKTHPFRNNNKGFNWGLSAKPLYESWDKTGGSNPPDSRFAWVSWKTNGKDGYAERVTSYKFNKIGEPLKNYIVRVAEILFSKATEIWPSGKHIFLRVFNENHTRYRENGDHENFGGESKIYEIVQDLIDNKTGLKHGKTWQLIDDWLPLMEEEVIVKKLVSAHRYNASRGWYNEVHGCDLDRIKKLLEGGVNKNRTVFSTDGLKPEKNPFFTNEQRKVAKLNLPFTDFKVPSDLSPYHDKDLTKTFKLGERITRQFLVP